MYNLKITAAFYLKLVQYTQTPVNNYLPYCSSLDWTKLGIKRKIKIIIIICLQHLRLQNRLIQ